jgi:hypothetical protein
MVKQKSQSKAKSKKMNKLAAVTILSLAANGIMLVALIVGAYLETSGKFDYALVNNGVSVMCSSQFRKTVVADSRERGDSANQQGLTVALVDYPCSQNGAEKYYQQGYKDYVSSLGLKQ